MSGENYFNLIYDAWIPVRRRSGLYGKIRPAQIVDQLDSDPVVSFEWARPDFQIACHEFMIGLLATAFPPATIDEWEALWDHPPGVKRLDEAFGRLAEAFYLNRSHKCFLQDFSELESSIKPVERLLIDSPGESTVTKNKDLFVHRGRITAMSLPEAAMALYTLQSWAPSGGSGNMTGVRGGGPMVTLVLPRRPDPDHPERSLSGTLWDVIWANTPYGRAVEEKDMPRVFPWLAPTIISGKQGRKIGPEDVAIDKRHCWWGMPRRIRLCFTENEGGILVTGWKQRPYGMDYTGWIGETLYDSQEENVVIHPLTPRYRQKTDPEWLSLHPQPGGVHYKHWAGLVIKTADINCCPADNVTVWRGERASCTGLSEAQSKYVRLLAAGYDMDKAKLRNFLESEMPLPGNGNQELQAQCDDWVSRATEASNMVVRLLEKIVIEVISNKKKTSNDSTSKKNKIPADAILYAVIEQRFTEQTEEEFFRILMTQDENQNRAEKWQSHMQKIALSIFDSLAPVTDETKLERAGRIISARRRLGAMVSCKGKKEGRKLAECLGLPV